MYKNLVFYLIYPVIIWGIPLIISLKIGKDDDRYIFRKIVFPYWYLLQLIFEKISGNRRIICRALPLILFFPNIYLFIIILGILCGFNSAMLYNETYYSSILFLYILCGNIVYLFQPKVGKIYRTK